MSMTEAQRIRNLRAGTVTREERCRLRVGLKAGEVSLEEALAVPAAQRMTVERLLLYLPGMGRATVPKRLRVLMVSGTRVVGELTVRERAALLDAEW